MMWAVVHVNVAVTLSRLFY